MLIGTAPSLCENKQIRVTLGSVDLPVVFYSTQLLLSSPNLISGSKSITKTRSKKWYFVMILKKTETIEIKHIPDCRARGSQQNLYSSPRRSSQETRKRDKIHFVGPRLKSEKCLDLDDHAWSWDPKHMKL